METHHLVLLGDVMQEGMFVIGEEGVRHPYLLSKVPGQCHTVIVLVGEGQSLVLPVLVQVDGDRVVLQYTMYVSFLVQQTNFSDRVVLQHTIAFLFAGKELY